MPDPVPLRRLLITPDRLPEEMKRLRQAALVRLPRAEFEDLVRRAARGVAARNPPRLVEARYRAALTDLALAGTAQWKVVHAGPGPGLLSLQANGAYETQARDRLLGRLSDRTGLTAWYLGPQVSLTWGERFSANAGVDVPLRTANHGFQNVPDYRIHGGLSWRF